MKKIAIIIASRQGLAPALTIHRELPGTELFYEGEGESNHCTSIESIPAFIATNFTRYEGLVFIGALGICVRAIAVAEASFITLNVSISSGAIRAKSSFDDSTPSNKIKGSTFAPV